LCALAAGIVDQDSPHSLGSRRKEMTAVIPVATERPIHEPQICFMDQRCCLKCLARFFLGYFLPSEFSQFVI